MVARGRSAILCYMAPMDRVGVRELRQNLSVYLDRVKAGESLEVTEHGHPVARLSPLSPAKKKIEEMIEEGRIRPAYLHTPFNPIPLPADARMTLSEALAEMRAGER
jgi:prevent-host-death family protein